MGDHKRATLNSEILVSVEDTVAKKFGIAAVSKQFGTKQLKKTREEECNQHESSFPAHLSFGEVKPTSFVKHKPTDLWNLLPCPVACWNDGETFNTWGLGIPINYDVKKKTFELYGCFCSPACMKRFITDRDCLGLAKHRLLINLKNMMVLVYKIHDPIIEAPPTYMLKKFNLNNEGLTIDEYRAASEMRVHLTYVPGCFSFIPLSICRQNVLTPEQTALRLQAQSVKELKSAQRLSRPRRSQRNTGTRDLSEFFGLGLGEGKSEMAVTKIEGDTQQDNDDNEDDEEETVEQEIDEDIDDDDDDDDDDVEQYKQEDNKIKEKEIDDGGTMDLGHT